MSRQNVNRMSAIAPTAMSITAFLLAMVSVTTGWGHDTNDEGAAAHIFQLLIALQIPFILAFLVTADWSRLARTAAVLSAQAAALALAFAPVAYYSL